LRGAPVGPALATYCMDPRN